jgi:hypothetical protein
MTERPINRNVNDSPCYRRRQKQRERDKLTGYTGPTSRLCASRAGHLGHDWVLQVKVDGMYAKAFTNREGRIVRMLSRTGKPIRGDEARDLLGCRILPCAGIVTGELEAHTPVGVKAAAARGYPLLHLFDCLALEGQGSLLERPYNERRAALYHAWVANADAQGIHRGPGWDERGKFCTYIPRGHERAPILPVHPVRRFDALWQDEVESGRAEGLVAVSWTAPVGVRRAKRKIKPYDSVDCIVLEDLGSKLAVRSFRGEFVVQWAGKRRFRRGEVIAVRHDGFYDSGVPRFARMDRVRTDLAA